MRGHDDLANRGLLHAPHQLQKFHLARRRQRGFRLVEDEDALPLAALFEEAQKAFAVGMGEKVRRGSAERFASGFIEVPGNGKEALGPEEPPLVTFGSQLARSALESRPPMASIAIE